MKCQGKFKFKGIEKREGGSFTNAQGRQINYDESYSLKVDEETEKGIFERNFKVKKDSDLVDDLLLVKPYTNIILEFDITFYGRNISVIPVALINK